MTGGVARRTARVGCAGLAVYAGLKAIWALGGDAGGQDSAEWRAMLDGLRSWQRFGAFWGWVLVDLAGAALLLGPALVPPRPATFLVHGLRGLGWLAGLALTLAGVAGLALSLGPAVGLWTDAPGDPGPLAGWVSVVVYGAFAVAGVAFLATAGLTRPGSRDDSERTGSSPGRSPPPDGGRVLSAGCPPAAA